VRSGALSGNGNTRVGEPGLLFFAASTFHGKGNIMKSFPAICLSLSLILSFFADTSSAAEKKTVASGLAELITLPVSAFLPSDEKPAKDLGEILITPSRTEEFSSNITKNSSVVSSEDIKDENPSKIQDIVSTRAGVTYSGYTGTPKDNNLDIRGFGEAGLSNVLVLIDGRRTNQIDLSGADLSQIDMNSIERIEITRGPGSVLYGDNASGGVMNIITKKGRTKDTVEYLQKYGSFRSWEEYVSVSGNHPFLDHFSSYSYKKTDGYRLNGGYEAKETFSRFTVKPASFFDLDTSFGYHRDWYGQPGALYYDNIRQIGRQGSRFPNSRAKTEDSYITAVPRLYGEVLNGEFVFSCLTSYRLRRSDSASVGFGTYESDHHITSLDLRPKAEINSAFFDGFLDNKFVAGLDVFSAKDEFLSGDIAFTKSQLDITKNTLGVYASDNMLLGGRYLLNGGVRGEWAEYYFDQFQPASSYSTRSPREIAWDCGTGYKYNERSLVYANYARSYRFPTSDEFFQSAYEYLDWWTGAVTVFPAVLNTGLKQQTGNNYEIGVKDHSFDLLSANACYFLMDMKNEIYYDPIQYRNMNYHRTIHHGFELEARLDVMKKVSPFVSYTFEKAFFSGGVYAGKKFPLVPENKLSAGVDITPAKGLMVDLITNFVGERYLASDQTNSSPRLKSHITLDMNVSYEIKYVRVFASLKNICDELYYSNGTKDWQGNSAYYPAQGRTFEWGVSLSF
jgi:iron complex outermembrane receptor protein